MRLASRLDHIEPFYVMEFAKAAEAIKKYNIDADRANPVNV